MQVSGNPPSLRILGAKQLQRQLRERFVRIVQLALRFLSFGDFSLKGSLGLHSLRKIPGNLCKTKELSGSILDCSDDYICPESRTIFAYAPAFVLEPAIFSGDYQFKLRLAVQFVFFGIKARKVLADNLVAFVTLEAFCPDIPTVDVAFRV